VSEPTRNRNQPLNEMRVQLYEELMQAQERIAKAQYSRGVDHGVVTAALDLADEQLTEDERREDLFLSSLAHFAGALGGHLEVRAVFDNEAVVVRTQPGKRVTGQGGRRIG